MDEHEDAAGGRTAERSVTLFRTACEATAEVVRVALALNDVRAAVLQGDPLGMMIGMTNVVVVSSQNGQAIEALQAALATRHDADWVCPDCQETVPNNFDLCWNCGMLHPSLSAAEWYAGEHAVDNVTPAAAEH